MESSTDSRLKADESPGDFLPQLSIAERDRRWTLIRREMRARGIAGLVVWGTDAFFNMGMANFRYLTHIGAQHGNCACVFPLEGQPIVYQGPPHMSIPFNYQRVIQHWVDDVRPFRGAAGIADAARELGIQGERLGRVGFANRIVPDTTPYEAVIGLTRELPEAEWHDASDIFEKLRLHKSAEEIGMLEEACRIARQTVDRLVGEVRPGVRECELKAAMAQEQIAAGAESVPFNLFASGPVSGDPNLWHLNHGVEVHTSRPLGDGDLVVCEFHTSYNGYLAASEFSVFLGDPPPELRRIADVALVCHDTYRSTMRAGVTLQEVWETAREPCLSAGLDYLELGFHGHGLASPEWPTVVYKEGMLGGAGLEDVRLEENMVFGLNVDIHDPRWKTNVGVQLGDTVHVTADEGRFLVNLPLDRFVFDRRP